MPKNITLRVNSPPVPPPNQLSIIRAIASQKCKEVFGVDPKPEQLQVIESIALKRDCVLIAGTGWGKTLVYFLPLVLWPNTVLLIITPLQSLGQEQQEKLESCNIPAINLVGQEKFDTHRLANGEYRAVFACPESVIGSRFKRLWESPQWNSRLQAVVIDEVHCVGTWGAKFRKDYDNLGQLRTWTRINTPFLAVSATLPPTLLKKVVSSLSLKNPTIVNVGNDRPNIKYSVIKMRHPASSFKDLDFLTDRLKTIIYFQHKETLEQAGHYLRGLLGNDRDRVTVYHSSKSDPTKELRLKAFRENKFDILLSTEAAGMGCDIPDIVRVIHVVYSSRVSLIDW